MTFLRVFDQFIVPFLLLFILVGGLGGLALGCGLLLRSAATIGFMHSMNRWISTRRATRDLELPRQAFQPSRGLGVVLAILGAFAAYYLVTHVQVPRASLSLANPRFGVALSVEFTKWLLVVGCLVSAAVGVLALFFPAALGAVQARMNRWVSTRTLMPADSERMRTPLDLLVETYPRAAGWIIFAASLLVAVAMAFLIAARWPR